MSWSSPTMIRKLKTRKLASCSFHPDGRPRFAGWDHACEVAQHLKQVAASVRVVDLKTFWPACPRKATSADWLEAGGSAEALHDIADHAPDWSPGLIERKAPPVLLPFINIRLWQGKSRSGADGSCTNASPLVNVTLLTGQGGVGKTLTDAAARRRHRARQQQGMDLGNARTGSGARSSPPKTTRTSCIFGSIRSQPITKLILTARSKGPASAFARRQRRGDGHGEPEGHRNADRTVQDHGANRARDQTPLDRPRYRRRYLHRQRARSQRGPPVYLAPARARLEIATSVILLAHPSLSGIASGSGLSGSTAWNNSGRAQGSTSRAKRKRRATTKMRTRATARAASSNS